MISSFSFDFESPYSQRGKERLTLAMFSTLSQLPFSTPELTANLPVLSPFCWQARICWRTAGGPPCSTADSIGPTSEAKRSNFPWRSRERWLPADDEEEEEEAWPFMLKELRRGEEDVVEREEGRGELENLFPSLVANTIRKQESIWPLSQLYLRRETLVYRSQ